ncbi:MAG: helix-turn-helix transcriptional regulator [bacterium]
MPSPGAERVARALLVGGPATAADLAAKLGHSPSVVRRHLDALVSEGLVSWSERPPFGPVPARRRGRPARVFALTDAGSHAFDVAYDDLAVSALRYLAEVAGGDGIAGFARRRAEDLVGRQRASVPADAGLDRRVAALAEALADEGYAASVAGGDAGVQLCQHHCPVSHAAAEFPQLCEAETEAFERLLGTHVLRIATIAHGDGVCTTLIPELMNRRSTT